MNILVHCTLISKQRDALRVVSSFLTVGVASLAGVVLLPFGKVLVVFGLSLLVLTGGGG